MATAQPRVERLVDLVVKGLRHPLMGLPVKNHYKGRLYGCKEEFQCAAVANRTLRYHDLRKHDRMTVRGLRLQYPLVPQRALERRLHLHVPELRDGEVQVLHGLMPQFLGP